MANFNFFAHPRPLSNAKFEVQRKEAGSPMSSQFYPEIEHQAFPPSE